jgi:hypothetical protein
MVVAERIEANLFDYGSLGGGLGLDDGLDAVLGLVNDGLDVVLALDLEPGLVEDLPLEDGLVLDDPLGLVDHLLAQRQVLHGHHGSRGHRHDWHAGLVHHGRGNDVGAGAGHIVAVQVRHV